MYLPRLRVPAGHSGSSTGSAVTAVSAGTAAVAIRVGVLASPSSAGAASRARWTSGADLQARLRAAEAHMRRAGPADLQTCNDVDSQPASMCRRAAWQG